MRLEWVLVVAGTLVPVLGVVATVVTALATRGRSRWIALIAIPALTLGVSFLIAEEVGRDGNLLFILLLALLYVGALVYYPVLGVIGVIQWFRARSSSRR